MEKPNGLAIKYKYPKGDIRAGTYVLDIKDDKLIDGFYFIEAEIPGLDNKKVFFIEGTLVGRNNGMNEYDTKIIEKIGLDTEIEEIRDSGDLFKMLQYIYDTVFGGKIDSQS